MGSFSNDPKQSRFSSQICVFRIIANYTKFLQINTVFQSLTARFIGSISSINLIGLLRVSDINHRPHVKLV